MSASPAVITRYATQADFDRELGAELADHDAEAHSGWWCVATDDFPCPAAGCAFVARHIGAAHRIVVWPSQDDRDLLSHANDAAKFGRNPRIVEYERSMGPCIAYDLWKQMGRPTHGFLPRPDNVPWRRL